MSAWDGAILALVGVLGGALLVVLLQLISTLRDLRKLVGNLAPNLNRTARESAELASHLNRLTEPMAESGESVARFLSALERLGVAVDRITRLAQTAGTVGAVVAPAVAAAVQAVQRSMTGGGAPPPADEETGSVEAPDQGEVSSAVEPGQELEDDR